MYKKTKVIVIKIMTGRQPCHSGGGKLMIHSFHCYMQNATIPCHSQELLPFLSVVYFFLPPFSTNHSSIPSHHILPLFLGPPLNLGVPRFIYNTLSGILFSSILCTCPNQRNLFNLIVSNNEFAVYYTYSRVQLYFT